MQIVVQKFGGTSMATKSSRERVIQHIQHALDQDKKLVVVVSAIGRKGDPYATDTLMEWIQHNGNALPARETDLLLSCGEIIAAATLCSLLQAQSIPATVLTGAQAGIKTDEHFGQAKIVSVDPIRVLHELEQGKVVIVTGFQGENVDRDITTLGRGGSDTSATALGAALQAEIVDIFTDVNGLMTSDPKIVKEARPIPVVTYTELCNMAHQGAKVVHPRAVEIAMQTNLPLRVRGTFSNDEGTLVVRSHPVRQNVPFKDRHITGLTHFSNLSQIRIRVEQDQYDLQLIVFKTLAKRRISVDFINVNPAVIMFTVFEQQLELALQLLYEFGCEVEYRRNCSKISIIGGGMNGIPGIMANIVEALTEENIPILQSADSNSTIWILIHTEHVTRALRALHSKFALHE